MQSFKIVAYLVLVYFWLVGEGGDGEGEEFVDNKGFLSLSWVSAVAVAKADQYNLKILILESQSNLRSYQKFKLRCPTQTLLGFTTGKFIGIPRVKLECCPTNPAC